MGIKLVEIKQIKEKPAIKAYFEVNNRFMAVFIEKQGKKYQIVFIEEGGKKAFISVDDWKDPSTRKCKRKLKLLGFDLKEEEIERIFFELANDNRTLWLEEWTPPKLGKEDSDDLEEKARELLKDPLLLQKIRTVLDFKIAGMGKKKLAIFLCLLSKNLKDPKERVSSCIYGKWGEGKSFLAEGVLSLFDFIRMNSATLASVYRDSMKDPWFYDGKILYFGDLGDEIPDDLKEVLQLFKQLMTEGEVVKKLVMGSGEELETVELKLYGYPVLIWTAQAPPEDEQQLSRILPILPELSDKQREIVREFSNFEKELPREKFYPKEIEELERVVKRALKILEKEALPVINPYARLINNCMSVHSPNVNRDRNKFFGIISAITHLYQFQRAKIKIEDREYVVTHPVDVLYALYLVGEEFETLFGALDTFSQKAYQIIKEKVEPISCSLKELLSRSASFEDVEVRKEATHELKTKAFTNEELAEWLNVHVKTARKLTLKLYKKGLLDRIKEGRSWKYYLLPEYKQRGKTNGVVLFDTQSMLEGLLSEKELLEWLDRYGFDMPQESIEEYSIKVDDLKHILTPEARVFEITYIPPWDSYEIKLFKPPFTFDFLLEDGNVLRVRKSVLDEDLTNEINREDKNEEEGSEIEEENKIEERLKEDFDKEGEFWICKRCKSRFLSGKDAIYHLKARAQNPEVCVPVEEYDFSMEGVLGYEKRDD
ncbi:hypothetical protein DRP04_13765 [Archaeoglobales archaeon]|nr:MAG: hypothetical protein DRP04_13765 [Archaeoglobales archaeon]